MAAVLSTVKKRAAQFKRGRESLENDSRSGRPSMATTQKNIDCIYQMVKDDKRSTVNHIANAMSISSEQVENILHKVLGMSIISLMGALAFDV